MAAAEVRVVLPGDRVPLASPNLGPGLCIDEDNSAVASIAGLLKGVGPEDELEAGKKKKRKTWVDYSGKRVRVRMELSFDSNIVLHSMSQSVVIG